MTAPVSRTISQKRTAYLVYWLSYVLLMGLVQGLPAHDPGTALINELVSLPPKMIFVFLVVEWLMVRTWGRWQLFVPAYLALMLTAAFLQRVIDNFLILPFLLQHWQKQPLLSAPPFLYSAVKLQFAVAVPACVYLLRELARERSAAANARAENLQAELAQLRSQFHPHFLFNVLNGIYSKVLDSAPEAPAMVLELSELMRYHVYEAGDGPVLLEKELHYLQTYIALQQRRFGSLLELRVAIAGLPERVLIEPMLLMPFVENGFKHALPASGAAGWISIDVQMEGGSLCFHMENSLGGTEQAEGGVGLRNVRRRLELLYPQQHELQVAAVDDRFVVHLKIALHGA